MKKHLLFCFMCCVAFNYALAQAPFNTYDFINVNNINARIMVHGDMFWDPQTGTAACFFPKGASTSINFAAALWMGGYDGGNNLHTAAQTYRQTGNDYWPGPLNTSDTLTYATSQMWANIWEVDDSDMQVFFGLSTHTVANTPLHILAWPGKGNTYAQGNGGVPLTVTGDMAPFVDLNGNGIYEPLLGEYPDVRGDKTLWWVFSDNGPTHNVTNGKPLGVEVHAMTYGYNRGTLMDNIVYFDYTVVNKSVNNYNNFRLGLFDDIDLGWYYDDFLGFDSSHRMGICYNGNDDDGEGGGFPVNSYGRHIPIVGTTMVVMPGDTGTSYVPAGSFMYFNNDNSPEGNPAIDTEYNNYLRSKFRGGQHLRDDFQGRGVPSSGTGAGPDCNYVFTGDPSDTSQWSECNCNNNPGDRRFVIASNSFTLNAGSSQHIVMALVTTNPDTANGCPGASFDSIKIYADTAWANYYNPPTPASVKNVAATNAVNIYPNPAHDVLYIEVSGNVAGEASVAVYNAIGQTMKVSLEKNGNKDIVDVSRLLPGLYNVLYRKGTLQKTATFVKE